jgi:hypothetical protein
MENFVHLEGENLVIKGATRVVSSTITSATVETGESCVIISGTEIEVKKLNLEDGEVCLSGKISNIKFGKAEAKRPSFMKRIFK